MDDIPKPEIIKKAKENLEKEMGKRGTWSQKEHLWTPNSTNFDEEMKALREFCLDTQNYIALIQLNI